MIRIAIVMIGVVAILILVGCAGGGDQQLRLTSGATTESEYRESVRGGLLGAQGVSMCVSLRGLSGSEAFEVLGNVQAGVITAGLLDVDILRMPTAELQVHIAALETAQVQVEAIVTVAASRDGDRAGRIIQEECARILDE